MIYKVRIKLEQNCHSHYNYYYIYIYIGREFLAVFLSTSEPVDSDGNTTNPTKSPCDPYIFNTVLTHSKSLVVVVGSPQALLRIEGHMQAVYGRKARCWSSFLAKCLCPPPCASEQPDSHPSDLDQRAAYRSKVESDTKPPQASASALHSTFYRNYAHKLESNSGLLRSPLTVENYKEKFHHLLCLEEREHARQLAEK